MTWSPPKSPVPLLQELYYPDKWKVLVCCIFLNCTQRKQVQSIIDEFFKNYEQPQAYIQAFESEITKQHIINLIKPLGFYNRRAERLYKFCIDFVKLDWNDPRELHGIGEYGARCVEMLFDGNFGRDPPDDHALKYYWHFVMNADVKKS